MIAQYLEQQQATVTLTGAPTALHYSFPVGEGVVWGGLPRIDYCKLSLGGFPYTTRSDEQTCNS